MTPEVSTAISKDLVDKAKRWKQLARPPPKPGNARGDPNRSPDRPPPSPPLPELDPILTDDVDKYEVASLYIKDALAGRESVACIHDQSTLRALKLVRNKAWNQLLNVCTIFHLILPMVEIQRCLPCMGMQKLPEALNSNSLHLGWRPTLLGSMWIECLLWLLYAYDLYKVTISSSHTVHKRIDASIREKASNGGGVVRGKMEPLPSSSLAKLPPWHVARMCMVGLLGFGLLTNIFAHYVFGITWHRWSRVTLPFLFISRRTYLKHFVGGVIRVLPRMLPVAFLMSFVGFFYAFLGYIVYRNEPRDTSFLGDLDLFGRPTSSALTFLRIFTSIPFMLDVEHSYRGKKGIQVMGLSYGVIMVIFLGALVPAVANRNFQYQREESYNWVKRQRKLALTRAFMLLRRKDGTKGGTVDGSVGKEDWVRLMACLRPDCNAGHTSALFDAAMKAEDPSSCALALAAKEEREEREEREDRRRRLSIGGFFMLCALTKASFSRAEGNRHKASGGSGGGRSVTAWTRFRQRLAAWISWSFPGSTFPLSRQILNVAVIVQGYQVMASGNDDESNPSWAYVLGIFLIAFFCFQAALGMIVQGPRLYITQWNYALGMCLNLIGVAYYLGFWFDGEAWRSFYHILQASRIVVLWHVLHRLGTTSSEVATRLELVVPAVLRASVVLFAVTYSYSVLAFAMYCATPLGTEPLGNVADHSMVQRWAFYKDVISFASLYQSFASMTDVIMLSNWPMFMDAAGDVADVLMARIFFYSFKLLTFYYVMPVMLGFIVSSYMVAEIPGVGTVEKPLTLGMANRSSPHADASSSSRASKRDRAGSGGAKGAGAADSETDGSCDQATPRRSRSSGSISGEKSTPKTPLPAGDDGNSGRSHGSKFGFSTLADDDRDDIDVENLIEEGGVPKSEAGADGDGGAADDDADDPDDDLSSSCPSSSGEDSSAPVVITSHSRSMSQTFWGAEQAKDHAQDGSAEASTEMQESLNRLETENASLRALVDSMQMDLQMANARLYDELQTPGRDRSPSPARASTRRGGVDTSGIAGKPLASFMSPDSMAPPRKRVGSANSVGGMEAIFETEDEEVGLS
ncbi:unnamed protein product [Scytosiphon promiscuus]